MDVKRALEYIKTEREVVDSTILDVVPGRNGFNLTMSK